MWYRGKRGFNLARLKRWLGLDDNVLTRELVDMTIDTCPVADWNGQSMQSILERLLLWQAGNLDARSDAEQAAFTHFPNPIGDDCNFFLHLLRTYDTQLRWWTVTANRDRRLTKELLFNPLLLPGFNDSGAHLTNMAFYDGNLRTLKMAQEDGEQKVATAVHRLTQEPADFFAVDAGTIKLGARADLVQIDPEALRRFDPEASVRYIFRDAFQHHQLVNRPEGVVVRTLIAGKCAWEEGAYVAAYGNERYGSVLRNRDHGKIGLKLAA